MVGYHVLHVRRHTNSQCDRAGRSVRFRKLLPLVYEELRVLARQRLANEKPGQTLQATALVHEAYLRLVGNENDQSWDNRGHFFAAAAEAMRIILVENARRKNSLIHGSRASTHVGSPRANCNRCPVHRSGLTGPQMGESKLRNDPNRWGISLRLIGKKKAEIRRIFAFPLF